MERVRQDHLAGAMKWFRDLRLWALQNNIDPWAVRQALLIALEMDTDAAQHRGISDVDLLAFDCQVRADAREWIKRQRHQV